MGHRHRHRHWRRRTALLAGALLALGACSGDDAGMTADDSATEGSAVQEAPAPRGDVAAEDDGGESAPDGDGARAQAQAGQHIIRTAYLVLEVEDTAVAVNEIEGIAAGAGGFIATTDLSRDEQGVVRGTVTLRVPSDQLTDTVELLDELAVAAPVQRIEEQNVTGEVVDLEAELTNLTAYESELRTLLTDVRESTSNPDDLLRIFERIREVRAQIDRAQARLDTLRDQVSLSTITVTLRPAASALPVGDRTWTPGETVRDALAMTTQALTALADIAIRVVLTALPILLLVLGPVVLLIWWLRRRSQRRTATSDGAARSAAQATPPPPPEGSGGSPSQG